MKKQKIKYGAFIFVTMLFGGAAILFIILGSLTDFDYNITANSLSVASLVVAIIAFFIAWKTYFNIDSVQHATAMEGNVLEKTNYSIEYSAIIKQFENDCKGNDLLSQITEKIKRIKSAKTCIQLADNIQLIIDNLIWLNFLNKGESKDDLSYNELSKVLNKKLRQIIKDAKRYESINSGLSLLFNENINLIISVLSYHDIKIEDKTISKIKNRTNTIRNKKHTDGNKSTKNSDKGVLFSMQYIRGKSLENPIAKMIYYIYVGRYFLDKATKLLDTKKIDFSPDEYRKKIEKFSETQHKDFKIYIEIANEAFEGAKQIQNSNILWDCILEQNRFKVFMFKNINNQSSEHHKKLEDYINLIKNKWERVLKLMFTEDDKNNFMKKSIESSIKQFG